MKKEDKIKSYVNIDYSKRRRKRFVQTFIYSTSKVRGNVLMLCGPAIKEHLNDAKLIMHNGNSSTCTIYERDSIVYKNIKKYKPEQFSKGLKIILGDIKNAVPNKFVDLDFCATLDSNFKIIKDLFNKMNKKNKNKQKHIIVTFCSRGPLRENNINKLCNLFNITNNFSKDPSLPRLKRYINKENDSYYISYRDGVVMTSFSHQWK